MTQNTGEKVKHSVPQADLVFDQAMLERWLNDYSVRHRNAYRSIRFEPLGAKQKDIDFVLGFLVDAIVGEYRLRGKTMHGLLYVREEFAGHPALASLVRKGEEGDYIAYQKG